MLTTSGYILGLVVGVGVPLWLTSSPTLGEQSVAVALDYATFEGIAAGPVTSFLGMPFAAPPVGPLRFAHPQPPLPLVGVQEAKSYGPGCFQQSLSMRGGDGSIKPLVLGGETSSEDCLTINVIKPANAPPNAKLPVIVSFHGGGFAIGSTSNMDFGVPLVARSMKLGVPVIYVSANYRLNAFGFLASEDVNKEGNLNAGLHDQRMALEWTKKYISKFGGDPKKVIIMGQSAGAISVGMHMLANNGMTGPLFRGAVMQSGTPLRLETYKSGQTYADELASLVGCTDPKASLHCLRSVRAELLVEAIEKTPDLMQYSSVKMAWQPRRESGGGVWDMDPIDAIKTGKVAKVPFIITANEDEGTMFALGSLNVTTNDQFKEYIQYITGMSKAQAEEIAKVYPEDPVFGSPFGTGKEQRLSPQFKRISAFIGDLSFHAPQRYLLQHASAKQGIPAWAYMFKAGKNKNTLGAYHGADMGTLPVLESGFDHFINFAYTLNPNTRPFLNPVDHMPSPFAMLSSLGKSMLSLSLPSASLPSISTFVSPLFAVPPFSLLQPNHTTLPYHWPSYTSTQSFLTFYDTEDDEAHPASKAFARPHALNDAAGSSEGGVKDADLGLGRGQRLFKAGVEMDGGETGYGGRAEAMDVLVRILKELTDQEK